MTDVDKRKSVSEAFRRAFTLKGRMRMITVHLNDKIALEIGVQQTNTILDILQIVSEQKKLDLPSSKYKFRLKTGVVLNNLATPVKSLTANELYLYPQWDPEAAKKLKLFGIPLVEASRKSAKGFPTVLEKCFKHLQSEDALNTVGLFRLNASRATIAKYKTLFDSGRFDKFPNDEDIHVIAGIVKLYLKELPEPVTTYQLFDEFIAVAEKGDEINVDELNAVIQKMPKINFKILKFIIRYLVTLCKYNEKNKVNPKNTGLVFGSLLFRSPSGLEETSKKETVRKLVTFLILKSVDIFGLSKEEKKRLEEEQRMQQEQKEKLAKLVEPSPRQTSVSPRQPVTTLQAPITEPSPRSVSPRSTLITEPSPRSISSNSPRRRSSSLGSDDLNIDVTEGDELTDGWKRLIEQWKQKYLNEVKQRKKEKEAFEIQKGQFDIHLEEYKMQVKELQEEIHLLKKEHARKEERWEREKNELLQTIKDLTAERDMILEKSEEEKKDLKRSHLLTLKKFGISETTIDPNAPKLSPAFFKKMANINKEKYELASSPLTDEEITNKYAKKETVEKKAPEFLDHLSNINAKKAELISSDLSENEIIENLKPQKQIEKKPEPPAKGKIVVSDRFKRKPKTEDSPLVLSEKEREKIRRRATIFDEEPPAEIMRPESPIEEIQKKCKKCKKPISEKWIEGGSDMFHHECFICVGCNKFIDGPFANRGGDLWCKDCLQSGNTVKYKVAEPPTKPASELPICAACNEEIRPGNKLTALRKHYHKQCFKCQQCGAEFEKRRFYDLNGIPVCKPCKQEAKKRLNY